MLMSMCHVRAFPGSYTVTSDVLPNDPTVGLSHLPLPVPRPTLARSWPPPLAYAGPPLTYPGPLLAYPGSPLAYHGPLLAHHWPGSGDIISSGGRSVHFKSSEKCKSSGHRAGENILLRQSSLHSPSNRDGLTITNSVKRNAFPCLIYQCDGLVIT